MSTPDIEQRLRAALSARAEQVQPEDLSHHATVVPLRRRPTAPLVVLAGAACVLLVLVVSFRLTDGTPRSDPAPRPDGPQVVLPSDVGRDWKADDLANPARLDLDGDGATEKVLFLAEPSKDFDGRVRLQTTLSTTGEEAYGLAELGTTIGTNALDPIDADDDGDQELVLYYDDMEAGPGGGGHPLVFDLRDGLLVQAVAEDPELLVRGQVPVPGGATEFYEMVRIHDYWIDGGRLLSSRSVNAYAAGNMTLMRPETIVLDTWEWTLDEDGVLRATEAGCMRAGLEAVTPCGGDGADETPYVTPVAEETIGVGGAARFVDGYRFDVRIESGRPPALVVAGDDGGTIRHELAIDDPRVVTVQPTSVFADGASLLVTSASDPSYVEVLVQDGDVMRALTPVGEVPLQNQEDVRSWLTRNGALVTVVSNGDETWRAWQWTMVSRTEMAALPTGTVQSDLLNAISSTPGSGDQSRSGSRA